MIPRSGVQTQFRFYVVLTFARRQFWHQTNDKRRSAIYLMRPGTQGDIPDHPGNPGGDHSVSPVSVQTIVMRLGLNNGIISSTSGVSSLASDLRSDLLQIEFLSGSRYQTRQSRVHPEQISIADGLISSSCVWAPDILAHNIIQPELYLGTPSPSLPNHAAALAPRATPRRN